MDIHGFQKTTLLDYPGQVAATVFTGGCNFRCPFCHNKDLVLAPGQVPEIPEEELFAHLEKRRKILDGVCVTGGEPTLQPDLEDFLGRIKELGLKVKLDTNGYRPEVLVELGRKKLIDYVAMDIKGAPEQYGEIAGVSPCDFNKIQASVLFLMSGTISYEFRTTVVRELHEKKDLVTIGKWINGAKAYYLQSYQDSEQVICPGFHGYGPEEMKELCRAVLQYVPAVQARGVD